jgi:hypothetical protein
MRWNVARWSIALSVALSVLGACSHGTRDTGEAVDAASGALSPSERAHSIARGVHTRFGLELASSGVTFVKGEHGITTSTHPSLSLPLRANGAMALSSRGVAIAVTLEGASDSAAETANGLVVYPGGGPSGADVIQRVDADSAEDHLVFEKAPAVEEIRYRVDVARAAGLRMIDGVVELLDASGAPRLRMARPWLVDRDGHNVLAHVAVDGCAIDRDPRAPWGRSVTAPGAASCIVRISWSNVSYPAVLDPSWAATTSTMTTTRAFHIAELLASNKVLLSGGSYRVGTSSSYHASAELYDPASKTFASTGGMTMARGNHASALLADGKVLVAGGQNSTGVLLTAETYDSGTGTWTATSGNMSAARQRHQMVGLGTAGVLVAGGQSATAPLSSADLYYPMTRTFAATGAMLWPRRDFTLAPIAGGKVLAANGWANLWPNVDLSQCEVFEPLTGAWASTGASSVARHGAGSAVLKDGRVIVAGGYAVGSSANVSTATLFSGTTGTWATTSNLSLRRSFPTLTTMGNGAVLAAGGVLGDGSSPSTYYSTVELYNGTSFLTTSVPAMAVPRYAHTATALPDGTVLIAGGNNALGTLGGAEIFSLSDIGQTCSDNIMCKTGSCVDGVCCTSACTTACYACSNTLTGVADGTCAPVKVATDPKNSCKDDGSPTCLNNGLCDGAGACQKYPISTGCTAQPCTSSSQCTTGYCYDGVCCNTFCSGTCKACSAAKKGYSVDGLCENVKDGTDPDSECSTAGSGACASDRVCNGAGTCRVTTEGTTCAPAACVGTASAASESTCSTTGACTPKMTTPCAPYTCDSTTAACRTTCTVDTECAPGLKCSAGACVGKSNGAPCSAASECTSGFCVDGVCCNAACTGQCESCELLGVCNPVGGVPRGTRPKCGGSTSDPACGNQCDGTNRTSCRYPGTTTACGAGSSCSGNNLIAAKRCNGSGSCSLSGSTTNCAPYACDPATTSCKKSCTMTTDCASGYICQGTSCVAVGPGGGCDGSKVINPDGTRTECFPFDCNLGRCRDRCTANTECGTGAVCDLPTNKCVTQGAPVAPKAEEDAGCGCAIPKGASHSERVALGLFAAALMGLTIARRRR